MESLFINFTIFVLAFVLIANLLILYFFCKVLSRLSDVLLSLESFLDRH